MGLALGPASQSSFWNLDGSRPPLLPPPGLCHPCWEPAWLSVAVTHHALLQLCSPLAGQWTASQQDTCASSTTMSANSPLSVQPSFAETDSGEPDTFDWGAAVPRSKSKSRKERRLRLRHAMSGSADAFRSEDEGPVLQRYSTDAVAGGQSICRSMPQTSNASQLVAPKGTDAHFVHGFSGHVAALALEAGGCRALQDAFERSPKDEQETLALELQGHVIRCAEHPNGNFVLQKCIEQLRPASVDFIAHEIKGRVCRLAIHDFGCRVVQRLLEYWPHAQLGEVLDELMGSIHQVSRNRFGNHVIQRVLQVGRLCDKVAIIEMVKCEMMSFATNKYASRVVECCFDVSYSNKASAQVSALQSDLARAITETKGSEGRSMVSELAMHPIGNYVLQKAVKVCNGKERCVLLCALAGLRASGPTQTPLNEIVIKAISQELEHEEGTWTAVPTSHCN